MAKRRIAYCAWLLSALCLYFFENNLGTRIVLLSSALIPLFSLGCALLLSRRFDASLSCPDRAKTCEAVACECELSLGARGVGCAVSCEISSENRMTEEKTGLTVPIKGNGVGRFRLSSEHCGLLTLTLAQAVFQDWFGIARIEKPVNKTVSVLMEPKMYPVLIKENAISEERGEEAFGGVLRENEPGGSEIRAYVPGDPIHRIHWKLSQKTDQTLIRESAKPPRANVLLLLETSLDEKMDAKALHSAAQALLSVSFSMAEKGILHSAAWFDSRANALQWMDADGEKTFVRLRDALLSTASPTYVGSVCSFLLQERPDARFRRIVLFSPRPDSDGLSLAENSPVTLVLPPFSACTGAESGIQVTVMSEKDAVISI